MVAINKRRSLKDEQQKSRLQQLCLGGVLGAVLVLTLRACASVDTHAEDSTHITQQLIAQADAWDEAIRKDRAAIEANMADRFFHIGGDGSIAERDEFVRDLLDPDLTIDPYQVESLVLRLHGDTALLTATTRMAGSFKGKRFSSHYRYIDTYVRERGRWKIVAVQITRLPQ